MRSVTSPSPTRTGGPERQEDARDFSAFAAGYCCWPAGGRGGFRLARRYRRRSQGTLPDHARRQPGRDKAAWRCCGVRKPGRGSPAVCSSGMTTFDGDVTERADR